MFLLGVRERPADAFRYLRIPADEQGSMDGFLRLRAALADPALREQAVAALCRAQAADPTEPELARAAARPRPSRALALFAGAEPRQGRRDGQRGGLQAISEFMEANVPEAERARAGEVLVRILNGACSSWRRSTASSAGLPPLPPDEKTQAFMTQAVLALQRRALSTRRPWRSS